ncbi:hypothetical protein BT63DRAFT_482301 [Microthyrium microscopicum]|uniref:Malate dehydrogenase n=1 Tax=Microthyrium microscopicum TaxID=703497 RepID=A0A6A6U070_9PEZI|nr:hypothetical protein BT63DRAFT_482301 [Microthyrium microscopicum]
MIPQALILLMGAAVSIAAPAGSKLSLQNATAQTASPNLPVLPGLQSPSAVTPAIALRYVTLGIGHQNYTCNGTSLISTGATAALFDITDVVTAQPELIQFIPAVDLAWSGLATDNMANNKDKTCDTQDFSRSVPLARLTDDNRIGFHFFAADKSPVFNLNLASPPAVLTSAKLGDVPAPLGATAGPGGAKAVDWLQLGDNGQGRSSGGVTYVYRVETAGGSPPATCSQQGSVVRQPYAAEYWFYGPSSA